MNTFADRQIEAKTATKLLSFIEEFRKLDPKMQIQQVSVFLHVMGKPNISMPELGKKAHMSPSSISRNVAALSKVHRAGTPGHDLVEDYEDPENRRIKRVRPTPKGVLVFNTLIELLGR